MFYVSLFFFWIIVAFFYFRRLSWFFYGGSATLALLAGAFGFDSSANSISILLFILFYLINIIELE